MKGAGLTLVELLVTLTIVGLVAAVTAPSLGASLDAAHLRAASRELVVGLKSARHDALAGSQESALVLDTSSHDYWHSGEQRRLSIPDEATISMTVAASEHSEPTRGRIRFFPDGSSTGGTIRLERRNVHIRIVVAWLTGRTTIEGQAR